MWYILCCIYYRICGTCLNIPKPHTWIAFLKNCSWHLPNDLRSKLIIATEFQSHLAFSTIYFVIRNVKIHNRWFGTLSLLGSLFGNNYGYFLDISIMFFFEIQHLALQYLKKTVIEIWTVCCHDRRYILVLFSAWGGIRFQLKWSWLSLCIFFLVGCSTNLQINDTEQKPPEHILNVFTCIYFIDM